MQNFYLSVHDNAVEQVLNALKAFSTAEVKLEKVESEHVQSYEKIFEHDPLMGFFADDINHPLSDEEIKSAIVQGATERVMRSRSNIR